MRKILLVMVLSVNIVVATQANNPLRVQPYPQETDMAYLNPAPLLVPYGDRKFDYVQFNLATGWLVRQATHTLLGVAEPNREHAARGEDFTNPWTLTALFGPSKKNYILTLIQVGDKEMKVLDVAHDGNRIQCGDWEIEAELSTKRPARLFIHNRANGATSYYGKDRKVNLNGTDYELQTGGASVLYDKIDGEWKTEEMTDIQVQSMDTWHAEAVTDN